MKNVVIYIHGKYGTAEEAEHYKKFFNKADIIGFEYTSVYPWDFQKEFLNFIEIYLLLTSGYWTKIFSLYVILSEV